MSARYSARSKEEENGAHLGHDGDHLLLLLRVDLAVDAAGTQMGIGDTDGVVTLGGGLLLVLRLAHC